MSYTIQVLEEEKFNKDNRKVVGEILKAYNDNAMKGSESFKLLEIVAKNEAGEVIGGLYGYNQRGWLYVDWLVIHEDYRKQGIGADLMKQAEKIALKRNLNKIRLSTFEFQAPDFYKKIGFKVVAIEEGFPEGFKTYYMQKFLVL